MKVFLILMLLLSSVSFAKNKKKARKKPQTLYSLAVRNFKGNKPFIASTFIKAHLMKSDKVSKSTTNLVRRILEETNIYPFLDVPLESLKKLGSHSNINYLIGKKLFFLKKNEEALNYFRKVNRRSPFYLQSLMHIASLYQIQGNLDNATKYAKRCFRISRKNYPIIPTGNSELQQKYREHIGDACEVLVPRSYYKQKKFKRATYIYERLDKQSYQFPVSLFDSSWAYLVLKDYNRAVGKNLTFQAPIFEDYFIAETELVKTLSYLKLCNYDDAISVIKNFEKNIRTKAVKFMKDFRLNQKGSYPFLSLIFGKNLKKKFKDNFIIKLVEVLDVKPSMHLLKHYTTKIKSEKARASTTKEKKAYLMSFKNFSGFFNTYVKLKFVSYMKEIIRISNIFAEIEVDLYSVIKHRLYDEKEGKKVRERRKYFFVKNVDRKVNQYYFDFQGEFWADELGHYIPLLENKCKKKLVKKNDEE